MSLLYNVFKLDASKRMPYDYCDINLYLNYCGRYFATSLLLMVLIGCIMNNVHLSAELEGSITFEVSASSIHQISVTFEHPLEQCMATAELDLSYISNIKCRLHSLASNQILCSEEYASKILQR